MTRARARALACLLLPLLGGCVMFERAPADLSCDPALAGRWHPLPSAAGDKMPLDRDDYAEVTAQCAVTLVDAASTADRPRFTARGFELEGRHYLVLSQDDMRQLFNDTKPRAPGKLPDASVLLVRYRIVDDVLELALPDMGYAVSSAKDKRLPVNEVDSMVYLARGDAAQLRSLLVDHPDLFEPFSPDSRNLRLRREPAGATP